MTLRLHSEWESVSKTTTTKILWRLILVVNSIPYEIKTQNTVRDFLHQIIWGEKTHPPPNPKQSKFQFVWVSESEQIVCCPLNHTTTVCILKMASMNISNFIFISYIFTLTRMRSSAELTQDSQFTFFIKIMWTKKMNPIDTCILCAGICLWK